MTDKELAQAYREAEKRLLECIFNGKATRRELSVAEFAFRIVRDRICTRWLGMVEKEDD